jgi:hypothetical protein
VLINNLIQERDKHVNQSVSLLLVREILSLQHWANQRELFLISHPRAGIARDDIALDMAAADF